MARKQFTKQQIKGYLIDPSKCPNCGEQVKIVSSEEDVNFIAPVQLVKRQIECTSCPLKFKEIFTLSTIEKLN